MPKRPWTITNFRTGIRHNISKEDLPDDTLVENSIGVNIDGSGVLKGFAKTVPFTYNAPTVDFPQGTVLYAANESFDGVHKNVTLRKEGSTSRISSYPERGPGEAVPIGEVTDHVLDQDIVEGEISSQKFGQHMYIGTGADEANPPLWYGKHQHKQFGQDPDDDIHVDDMECKPIANIDDPNTFPEFQNASDYTDTSGNVYMLATSYFSQRVYMFRNGVPFLMSEPIFSNPTATLMFKRSPQPLPEVFVFDSGTNRIVKLSFLSLGFEKAARCVTFDSTKIVNEMAYVTATGPGNRIYMSRKPNSGQYAKMEEVFFSIQWDFFNNQLLSPRDETPKITHPNSNRRHLDVIRPREPHISQYENGEIEWYYRMNDVSFLKEGTINVAGVFNIGYKVTGDEEEDTIYENVQFKEGGIGGAWQDAGNFVFAGLNNVLFTAPEDGDARRFSVLNTNLDVTDAITFGQSATHFIFYRPSGEATQVTFVPRTAIHGDPTQWIFEKRVQFTAGSTTEDFLDEEFNNFIIKIPGAIQHILNATGSGKYATYNGTTMTVTAVTQNSFGLVLIPGGFSELEKSYLYAASYIYDGYQESPLTRVGLLNNADEEMGAQITLKLLSENISRRISGINLYRAEIEGAVQATPYRLVEYIKFETNIPSETLPVYNPADPQNPLPAMERRVVTFEDGKAIFELGAGFLANSGIPETISKSIVHFGCSAKVNEWMFVGNVWHPDIDDGQYMVVRSSPGMFSVYNWEVDIVRIPFKPLALAEFGGRLYAIGEKESVMINPSSMIIERALPELSAMNQYAVAVTDFGLVTVGKSGVYATDGNQVTHLSSAIEIYAGKDGIAPEFAIPGDLEGSQPRLTYDSYRNKLFLFVRKTISGHPFQKAYGYQYSFDVNAWSLMDRGSDRIYFSMLQANRHHIAFQGEEIFYYFANQDNADTDTDQWSARLKPFIAENEGIKKWLYAVIVEFKIEAANFTYEIQASLGADDQSATSLNGTVVNNTARIMRYNIPKGDSRREGFKYNFRLHTITGNKNKVKSITFLYRSRVAFT